MALSRSATCTGRAAAAAAAAAAGQQAGIVVVEAETDAVDTLACKLLSKDACFKSMVHGA
jgi:hypothetical protein